jgi:DNA-binding MarR family transcriptional regulator
MSTNTLESALRTTISTLHKAMRRQMGGFTGYSMTELETIGHILKNKQVLPTQLAKHAHITTQSMSQILAKLEQQYIIRKTPSRTDKRKVYISLTAHGKSLVQKTRYERDAWLKNTIDKKLTGKEKKMIEQVLPLLKKLTEGPQE